MHAKIVNGKSVQYPYTMAQFRRDNPNTSFQETITDTVLAEYGVYPVTELEPPEFDPLVHDIVPKTPWLEGNEWKVIWSVAYKSKEENV